jgi:hypothetical protein
MLKFVNTELYPHCKLAPLLTLCNAATGVFLELFNFLRVDLSLKHYSLGCEN